MKNRLSAKENILDENGNIVEVIIDGKRYYPPIHTVDPETGIECTCYRPILTAEERRKVEEDIIDACLSIGLTEA